MSSNPISNVERLQFFGNRLLVRSLRLALAVLPVRAPTLLSGSAAISSLAEAVSAESVTKPLVITSPGIVKRGQADKLVRALERAGLSTVIFDCIEPDPRWTAVDAALETLHSNACDGVIAVGGGSAIDVAKVISLAATNRGNPRRLAGYFKARRRPLPLFAVPTTAGSGSETTIAAVISDDSTKAKSFVVDTRIVPLAAAIEPRLLAGMPAQLTAATGMDALTHAIEAYLSVIATAATSRYAGEAVQLVMEYLPRAYVNSDDLEAREAMLIASFKAGRAFTQASVGYVHAISHQLGAHYGVAHGLANAIVLPHVLAHYRDTAREALARLAVLAGLGDRSESSRVLADRFIDQIVDLNASLAIPAVVSELQERDIPAIATGAVREALLNYPVPRQMGRDACEALLYRLLAQAAPATGVGKSAHGWPQAA